MLSYNVGIENSLVSLFWRNATLSLSCAIVDHVSEFCQSLKFLEHDLAPRL